MHGPLTDIGVAENESPTQLVLMPIHFTANDTEESLAIDQDFDTVLLDYLVELSRFLHVLEVVGKTRTATVLNTNPNELWFRLIHQFAKLFSGHCG